MCGICGVIGEVHPEIEPSVRRMMDAMTHRGPDDEGYERLPGIGPDSGTPVAFGFRRLAIIDLSPAGHQPMLDPQTGNCLVFNGEIYNFQTLRRSLQLEGHFFRGTSDSEVLLRALTAWGLHAIDRIEGMFAFAWYDARERRMTLARDRSGVKPLYWTLRDGRFAFASEIKALHTLPWLDRRVDVRAAVAHVSTLCSLGDATMFAGVRRLRPGHLLTVDGVNGPCIRRYATVAYRHAPALHDRRQASRMCLDVVRDAVTRQCVADVTVGGFLSGGVDSSVIATLASRAIPTDDGYPVFTVALEQHVTQTSDGFAEDLPYAELMARHLHLRLTGVTIGAHQVLDIDRMTWQMDEPIGDPAAVNVSAICAAARAQGVKVLLSGTGADDVFSGYRRHKAVMYQAVWTWLPFFIRRALASTASAAGHSRPSLRRLGRVLRDATLSENERIIGSFMWIAGQRSRELLSREALESLGGWTPEAEFERSLEELPRDAHRLTRMLHLEQQHFLADHNLVYTDKMSMAHGVEVRVPFLDDAVVRFAASVSPRLLHRTWDGKSVVRDAFADFIPPAIMRRPKTGFGVGLRRTMTGDLVARVRGIAEGGNPVCGGLFSPAAIRDLVAAHVTGRIDASYPLFAILCIESWMRQFRAHM